MEKLFTSWRVYTESKGRDRNGYESTHILVAKDPIRVNASSNSIVPREAKNRTVDRKIGMNQAGRQSTKPCIADMHLQRFCDSL